MSLSKDKIEQMAPDQASLSAALKLMKPTNWPMMARDASASLLWGECQGSGATPYRVIVSPDDVGYKCTCPSRKFPCKHVLAVMWTFVDKPDRFGQSSPPDWVGDWLSRKRKSPSAGRPVDETVAAQPKSLAAAAVAEAVEEKPLDPKAIARAAAQRERIKAEREQSVGHGLDELDRWIVDQVTLGLGGFASRAADAAKTLSTRLVDAKAGALAGRLDALIADIYRVPEQQRADVAMERLAGLALIASAFRHQDRLPQPLVAELRRTIGWSQKREELLADATAPRVTATWSVIATRSEVQPDKLRRLETWLYRVGDAANVAALEPGANVPEFALLLDFVPVSGGAAASPFVPGEFLSGEVAFYPSSVPLRGLLATRSTANVPNARRPRGSLAEALATYDAHLALVPWLEVVPCAASAVVIRPLATGASLNLALADSATLLALPIDPRQTEALTPLLGLAPLDATFTWDGHMASLLAVETPIGPWHDGR